MLQLGNWLAFTAASALIAVLPGPGVATVVGYAVNSGRRTAFAAIFGAVAGNLLAITVSLAGGGRAPRGITLARTAPWNLQVPPICSSSALSRSCEPLRPQSSRRESLVPRSPYAAFVGSIAVSALNPKSIIFFVAFVPQFISSRGSYLLQACVFLLTFASIVTISDALYALAALHVAGLLSSPAVGAWVWRAGGWCCSATGILAAIAGWLTDDADVRLGSRAAGRRRAGMAAALDGLSPFHKTKIEPRATDFTLRRIMEPGNAIRQGRGK